MSTHKTIYIYIYSHIACIRTSKNNFQTRIAIVITKSYNNDGFCHSPATTRPHPTNPQPPQMHFERARESWVPKTQCECDCHIVLLNASTQTIYTARRCALSSLFAWFPPAPDDVILLVCAFLAWCISPGKDGWTAPIQSHQLQTTHIARAPHSFAVNNIKCWFSARMFDANQQPQPTKNTTRTWTNTSVCALDGLSVVCASGMVIQRVTKMHSSTRTILTPVMWREGGSVDANSFVFIKKGAKITTDT